MVWNSSSSTEKTNWKSQVTFKISSTDTNTSIQACWPLVNCVINQWLLQASHTCSRHFRSSSKSWMWHWRHIYVTCKILLMTSSGHAHLHRHHYDIAACRDVAPDAKTFGVDFWRGVYRPGEWLWIDFNGNKKASIRWQDSARRQFQAGLRGDIGL